MLAGIVLVAFLSPRQNPEPTIRIYQGSAIVRVDGREERVPLTAPVPKVPPIKVYRRNQFYAVWDSRGLTVRVGDRVQSWQLEDVAVSPRAQSVEEIRETLAKISSGERKKAVSGLSGSCRLGTVVYFLARWTDRSGETWLEALVSVDLAKDDLHPRLIGRFKGFSLGSRPIEELLRPVDGGVVTTTRVGGDWGRANYDVKTEKFRFERLGTNLQSITPRGLFTELNDLGLYVAGRIPTMETGRRLIAESRQPMRFIDDELPTVIAEAGQLRNGQTGAVLTVPTDSNAVRFGEYVIVYSPRVKPMVATLYSPKRWEQLATSEVLSAPSGEQPPN